MATLLKVLNNLADIKSAGGVALRVRTQESALQDRVMAERIYGMHHIGITVPDIEQGIAFFEAAFGAVTVFRTGPFNVDETFMQRKLGAIFEEFDARAIATAQIRVCGGEDSTARPKRVSEVGGTHLCFEVDDVFASAERLRAKTCRLPKAASLLPANLSCPR
jgi:catechol 2,3-dioxygenase-like lactoylglutathione lyase family enzyme